MPPVTPIGELLVDAVGAVFPLQETPSIIVTDYAFNFGVNNTDAMDELKIDAYAAGAMPVPIFVPHGQNVTDDNEAGKSIVDDGFYQEVFTWHYDSGGDDPSQGDIPDTFEIGLDDSSDQTGVGDPGTHPPGGSQVVIEPGSDWTPSIDDQNNFAQLFADLNSIVKGGDGGGNGGSGGSSTRGIGGHSSTHAASKRGVVDPRDTGVVNGGGSSGGGPPTPGSGGDGSGGGGASSGDTVENAAAQGVTFIVGWDPASLENNVTSDARVNWVVAGDGSENDVIFSVHLSTGDLPKVEYSRDQGETFQTIVTGVRPSQGEADTYNWVSADTTDDPGYYTAISVAFINYVMRITVGGMTTPVLIPLRLGNSFTESQIDPTITSVSAQVSNFTYFSVSCHLLKWASDAWRQSGPVNLGEPTQGIILYRINGIQSAVLRPSGQSWDVDFPQGSQIMVLMDPEVSSFSQNQVYQLYVHNEYLYDQDQNLQMWQGIPYSDLTCVVTRIGIGAPGSWFAFASPGPAVIIPKEIQEDVQFDKQNLTISHRMSFVVDNFDGSINLGNTFGEKAVNLRVGYSNPPWGLVQRFKGKARRYEWMRSSASQANVRVYCEDQMYQLRDSYSFAPPDMDGWNIYAAAAFLAQVAGISALQMNFANLVPAVDPFTGAETTLAADPTAMIDPDGVSPMDPNFNPVTGEQGYFLPFGFGMRPWTPIDRVSSVLDLMNYIRQPVQALMFFDNFGGFNFRPWFPPVAGVLMPNGTFTEFAPPDDSGPLPGPPLTEVWNTSVSWSSEDIRNVVSVIGVDSTAFSGSWNPIVTAIYDTDSIFNPNVFNYVGYRKAFVQMDSKFANFPFAAAACLNYFRVFRVPMYEANFECWLRPDVDPMNSIQLAEYKSGVVNIQLYVMSVQHIWTVLGGSMRFRTNVHAEFITPFVFFNPFGFGAQSALPAPEPVAGSLAHLYANQEHRQTEAAGSPA